MIDPKDLAQWTARKPRRAWAKQWMKNNRTATEMFFKYMEEACQEGRRFGSDLVVGRLRWKAFFSAMNKGYKWNNSVTPYATEKFLLNNPQYEHLVACDVYAQRKRIKGLK